MRYSGEVASENQFPQLPMLPDIGRLEWRLMPFWRPFWVDSRRSSCENQPQRWVLAPVSLLESTTRSATVAIPNGRTPPCGLGISTRLTGWNW